MKIYAIKITYWENVFVVSPENLLKASVIINILILKMPQTNMATYPAGMCNFHFECSLSQAYSIL